MSARSVCAHADKPKAKMKRLNPCRMRCTCEARVVIRLPVSRRTTRAADQEPERGQRSENARAAEGGRGESVVCLCSFGGSWLGFVWSEHASAGRGVSQ